MKRESEVSIPGPTAGSIPEPSPVDRLRAFARGRGGQRWKLVLIGKNINDGLIGKIILYYLLTVTSFLYVEPFLRMISTMLKPLHELLNPAIGWLPHTFYLHNLAVAWQGLDYPQAFFHSLTIAFVCSAAQVFVCSITGYALARLPFPGKKLLFALVFLTLLIPPQVLIIPMFVIYGHLGWLNTPLVFIVPAIFGQGLRSGLFIIIFAQFFRSLPKALEEAALIDGASVFRLFFRIILPLSKAACLVVFLFSFIWYWNESYLAGMFLSQHFIPLSLRLSELPAVLDGANPLPSQMINNPVSQATKMAGAFLIILPPLLLYAVAQRWFVEGIERTGLVD